jgi:hypothetical protein
MLVDHADAALDRLRNGMNAISIEHDVARVGSN